jgi:hypothetical protein
MSAVLIAGFTGLVTSAAPHGTDQDHPWWVHGSYTQSAEQTVLEQPYEPKQTTFTVQRRIDGNSHAGAGHEYRVLDLPRINGVKAEANGDLHRLGVGYRNDTQQLRYRLAIGLAVSSNALKNLDDLDFDDVRAAGAIEKRVGERWWVALRADDNFGRFRLYPGFEWFLQPAPAHELRIGFPESSWRWQWTPQLRSELAVAPDGGRWRVRDADTDEQPSIVRQSSWQVAWNLRWQALDAFAVEARVGRTFDTTLRYQLTNGTEARVDPPDANFAGLAASLRF